MVINYFLYCGQWTLTSNGLKERWFIGAVTNHTFMSYISSVCVKKVITSRQIRLLFSNFNYDSFFDQYGVQLNSHAGLC